MEKAKNTLPSKGAEVIASAYDHDQDHILSRKETKEVINQDKVVIIINERQNQSEPQEVFASINGYAYQIKRGVEVEVPRALCNVLNESIETKYMTKWDSDGRPVVTEHQVPSYPYRIIREGEKTKH